MKVVVSEMRALGGYVSREFYCVMRELLENYGWRQIETAKLLHDPRPLRAALAAECGREPETILFWEGYHLLNARASEVLALDCRKCIFADDLHSWDAAMKRGKHVAYLLCDTILCAYAYAADAFFPALSSMREVVWAPHAAAPDFLLPFNERAENAVLLSGAVSEHYPLRRRLKALHDAGAYAVRYHAHPGYRCDFDHARDESVGRGYARAINRHRAAFTDAPKYGYLVAKYFEIPATGALLLADRSVAGPFRKLGFVDGVHYLSVSDEDLEEKIEYVLDEKNHGALDEVRRAGQRLVWARHQTRDRARLIDEACAPRA
jgi:Glycosyl transferases group 1